MVLISKIVCALVVKSQLANYNLQFLEFEQTKSCFPSGSNSTFLACKVKKCILEIKSLYGNLNHPGR